MHVTPCREALWHSPEPGAAPAWEGSTSSFCSVTLGSSLGSVVHVTLESHPPRQRCTEVPGPRAFSGCSYSIAPCIPPSHTPCSRLTGSAQIWQQNGCCEAAHCVLGPVCSLVSQQTTPVVCVGRRGLDLTPALETQAVKGARVRQASCRAAGPRRRQAPGYRGAVGPLAGQQDCWGCRARARGRHILGPEPKPLGEAR